MVLGCQSQIPVLASINGTFDPVQQENNPVILPTTEMSSSTNTSESTEGQVSALDGTLTTIESTVHETSDGTTESSHDFGTSNSSPQVTTDSSTTQNYDESSGRGDQNGFNETLSNSTISNQNLSSHLLRINKGDNAINHAVLFTSSLISFFLVCHFLI